MKLYISTDAPTDRRILVTAIEAGLEDRIEVLRISERDPGADLSQTTPLGQVPVLVREDGSPVVGASAICAWLDALHERPKLMPNKGEARLELHQLEAYADELLDAVIARERELRRPESLRWEDEAMRQWRRAVEVLDRLESLTDTVLVGPVTLGHIAVACALAWTDARLPRDGWRDGRPALSHWYDRFSARPSMRATGNGLDRRALTGEKADVPGSPAR